MFASHSAGVWVPFVSVYKRRVREIVNCRRFKREHRASRAPGGLPAAETLPPSPSRPYNEGSARRCWLSALAELEVVSKAIIWVSIAADCNPPSRATPSECRPPPPTPMPNQVRKVTRSARRQACSVFSRGISQRLIYRYQSEIVREREKVLHLFLSKKVLVHNRGVVVVAKSIMFFERSL